MRVQWKWTWDGKDSIVIYRDAGELNNRVVAAIDAEDIPVAGALRVDMERRAEHIVAHANSLPACTVCGCTEIDCFDCIEAAGEPCSWVQRPEHPDGALCSRCAS